MAENPTGTGASGVGESETTPPKSGSTLPASAPSSPPAPTPVPEPVIIEETVVKAAPTAPSGPAQEKVPTQAPVSKQTPAPIKAPEPATTPIFAVPPQEGRLAPAPAEAAPSPRAPSVISQPPAPPQSAPVSQKTPPPPSPSAALPSVVLPVATLAKEAPSPEKSPVQPLPKAGGSGSASEAITRILEGAKLPERRDVPPSEGAPTQKEQKRFDTMLGASAELPKEPPVPTQPPKPSSGGLAAEIVAPLRTLKNDLQEIVRVKKISLVRAAALEQEKRRERPAVSTEITRARARRTRGILFAAAILVILGGAALFGVYIVTPDIASPPQGLGGSSLLFAESTFLLPLEEDNPLDLKRFIAQARGGGSATLGSITRVVPTITETGAAGTAVERAATVEEFFSALGVRSTSDLVRALGSDFFFGIHTVDENAPLFVIPVRSYERAFAGMLAWEQTMNSDLSPAFTAVPSQFLGQGGLPEKRRFSDVVMRNYDVRALKDDRGGEQVYYSFPTRALLVIGESPYSFTEILARLRAERKL